MNSDIKRKLDDLNELLNQNYITDAEYAIARENVLADAGIDIVPRMDVPIVRDNVRPFQVRREQRNSGCGCFLVLLLLLVAAAGCLLALPEDITKKIPGVGALIDEPRYQEIRQTITQFIDDLRGNPAPAPAPDPILKPDPAPVPVPAPVLTPEPKPEPKPESRPRRRPRTSNFGYTAAPVPDEPLSADNTNDEE
ncbi:MAG: hypothetical protein K5841_00875 [Fretibacterium sp.]|nr:hypothetical protein [Fretibacterium sp.]